MKFEINEERDGKERITWVNIKLNHQDLLSIIDDNLDEITILFNDLRLDEIQKDILIKAIKDNRLEIYIDKDW